MANFPRKPYFFYLRCLHFSPFFCIAFTCSVFWVLESELGTFQRVPVTPDLSVLAVCPGAFLDLPQHRGHEQQRDFRVPRVESAGSVAGPWCASILSKLGVCWIATNSKGVPLMDEEGSGHGLFRKVTLGYMTLWNWRNQLILETWFNNTEPVPLLSPCPYVLCGNQLTHISCDFLSAFETTNPIFETGSNTLYGTHDPPASTLPHSMC